MKSIKEKSFELYHELRTASDEWDVIEEQCDRDDQRKAFVLGANYVLEQIENFMKDLDLGNSAEEKFYKLDILADIGLFFEQLKK